ncbi:hypothetical protein F3K37_42380 [Streptomyces sp. LBUM 1477]|nr:hypothetical protein [Streptomyces sp. LBUM 1477]MBP5880752.1 hypothetical protein [Streptomyces sp. LBUM 1477]
MRITATITPVHGNNTVCRHPLTPAGKPKDSRSGCTGRSGYIARCSACTWRRTGKAMTELEDPRDAHLRSHIPAPDSATG